MTTHLVWFRQDLRLSDNPALYAACQDKNAHVIALFIATPGQWHRHGMAARQASYLWQHLVSLQSALYDKNIELQLAEVNSFDDCADYLEAFCQQQRVDALFYNYQYPIDELKRDSCVEKRLSERGVICQGFDANVLFAPGSIVTQNGQMYKIFTPFSKACASKLKQGLPDCFPAPEARHAHPKVTRHQLNPFNYAMQDVDRQTFPVGEQEALTRLRAFCRVHVGDYPELRDIPARDGTSRLSAWLAIGVLSPRQCLHRLLAEYPAALDGKPGWVWLNELLWRDFYCHLLVAWPKLCRYRPFIDWTDKVAWSTDEQAMKVWQQGQTGYPIVDAAMRQLNQTGWMHNRLRMISASFLTKDLLIDWRAGERYFINQLIDGDLASNNGGWQWAASTGTDAVPYFRIFNPITQGKKFDPQGTFIRRWLPELKSVPDDALHDPWVWADKAGQTLDYPRPCIDHQQARRATLEAWEKARNKD